MSDQHAAGSPESGDPAAAVPGPVDPWAPPPPGWQPPQPPASPPPPYAAPPGWQPPPPPYGAPTGWQPSGQPQPSGWSPPYAQPRNTNGFAIASLVCGIAGVILPLIGGLLGVIFGLVGLNQTRSRGEGGRGLAIAGLVIGALTLLFWALVFIVSAVHSTSGDTSTVSPLLGG